MSTHLSYLKIALNYHSFPSNQNFGSPTITKSSIKKNCNVSYPFHKILSYTSHINLLCLFEETLKKKNRRKKSTIQERKIRKKYQKTSKNMYIKNTTFLFPSLLTSSKSKVLILKLTSNNQLKARYASFGF